MFSFVQFILPHNCFLRKGTSFEHHKNRKQLSVLLSGQYRTLLTVIIHKWPWEGAVDWKSGEQALTQGLGVTVLCLS